MCASSCTPSADREEHRAADRRGRRGKRLLQSRDGEAKPERDIDHGAGEQRALQAEQRQAEVHREQHAGDRAERVGGVDPADRGLAGAAAQQRAGDQRQRHAGAERRRQHHQRRRSRRPKG